MARLLLDTHVLMWSLSDPAKLGAAARSALRDSENEVLVSAGSIWEIAIKRASGKLRAPEHLRSGIEQQGFQHLPMTFVHAERAGSLPLHHRDPFDRMLIAQAQIENLMLVTADARIAHYEVPILSA